ncbi:FKBP-type peptidyl-prolyl cis-trans isomerase / Macrophage infectivity potentiator [Pseudoalteromonas luteoviolacea B = ATCC 29581]|nr:FKBP-type peptidyl-prolyl cis-trans isomerase / Macrophage infectivity potentiator [Pseudoalteromonas luteoviolacea B = ATCC 29581]
MSTLNIVLIVVIIFMTLLMVRAGQKNKAAAAENIAMASDFLVKNRERDAVIETASGLQYEVLIAATGDAAMPSAVSSVSVHYHGTLLDGTVFDSSVNRGKPISFKLSQVIAGWTEGLQLMKEGEKVRFFIPSQLAYGNRGVGAIPAGSLLIFDVELLKVES